MSTAKGADVLVLAAHAPELVGLRATLGTDLAGVVRGLRIVCATVGVGMPVAAAGAMRHLRDARPRAVVLLGSCGVYPKHEGYSLLDLVVPEHIALVDPAVVAGKGAFPAPMQTLMATDDMLSRGLCGDATTMHRGSLATTLAITTDDTMATRLGKRSGCQTENLEAFAVASACAARALPFAALLSITNVVGSDGRKQWTRYQRRAAEASARALLDWVHRGSRGLPARA
jgi:nucleoside phosphorylase